MCVGFEQRTPDGETEREKINVQFDDENGNYSSEFASWVCNNRDRWYDHMDENRPTAGEVWAWLMGRSVRNVPGVYTTHNGPSREQRNSPFELAFSTFRSDEISVSEHRYCCLTSMFPNPKDQFPIAQRIKKTEFTRVLPQMRDSSVGLGVRRFEIELALSVSREKWAEGFDGMELEVNGSDEGGCVAQRIAWHFSL